MPLTLLVYLKNNGHIMDTAQELFFPPEQYFEADQTDFRVFKNWI